MIPQETTFTIGQFAAIHGIHKKTLMWYDQVGLLSPAFVGELSLSGTLRPVAGMLPMALAAREAGVKRLYVPALSLIHI